MDERGVGLRIRRVFLWAMVVSFCVAAGAGILVLLGVSFGETGGKVLLSTVTVGLFSLAMLCCGATFARAGRSLGVAGVVVSMLTLGWSLVLIWREWSWDFEPFQVLFSGITLTIALSFANLVVASTAHRDQLIRLLLAACLGLTAVAVLLTLLLIWDSGWEGESFPRLYGVVLILAVLCGVLAPLLSSLRKRAGRTPGPGHAVAEPPMAEGAAVEREPVSRPGEPLDPALVAALEREAARRGVSVVQLVHQQWPRERE